MFRKSVVIMFVFILAFHPIVTAQNDVDERLSGSYVCDIDGWRCVHIEGEPYKRGFQHGYLLGENITYNIEVSCRGNSDQWNAIRANAVAYWHRVPLEYKQEIRGIADGVGASGHSLQWANRDVDWVDILSLNCIVDTWYKMGWDLSSALREGGCSAFAAAGSATEDGGIVIGHNTWTTYVGVETNYFMIEIRPKRGYDITMQAPAGCIWSMMDWYINGAGLVVTETTLGRGPYDETGMPIFVRAREAVQYSDNIDQFVAWMTTDNNGAYSNDWLVADAKTGEIAILELGSRDVYSLKRTFDGFFGSCNFAWNETVRDEQEAREFTQDGCYPRWIRWAELSDQHYGNITVETGKIFLADHFDTQTHSINPSSATLCGHSELNPYRNRPSGAIDGKVTNSSMALNMMMWARRGHPCGMDFNATDFLAQHPQYEEYEPYLADMPAYDWTIIGPREIEGMEQELNVEDVTQE